MALDTKKYERMFSKTGSDADKVSSKQFAEMKADFDTNDYIVDPGSLKTLGPALYQIQLIQDELDTLRDEIDSNKDKTTFPGLGTSSSTALSGDTTVISSGQASAITANTAKVSLIGGTGTALSFGEMITTGKGKTATYSIVMTAVKKGVSKSVTLTLT